MFDARRAHVQDQIVEMRDALRNDEFDRAFELAEQDSLSLAATTMTGPSGWVYWQPATLAIFNRVRELREEEDIPVYFSTDTGASVYVNTTEEHAEFVEEIADCGVSTTTWDVGGPARLLEEDDHLFWTLLTQRNRSGRRSSTSIAIHLESVPGRMHVVVLGAGYAGSPSPARSSVSSRRRRAYARRSVAGSPRSTRTSPGRPSTRTRRGSQCPSPTFSSARPSGSAGSRRSIRTTEPCRSREASSSTTSRRSVSARKPRSTASKGPRARDAAHATLGRVSDPQPSARGPRRGSPADRRRGAGLSGSRSPANSRRSLANAAPRRRSRSSSSFRPSRRRSRRTSSGPSKGPRGRRCRDSDRRDRRIGGRTGRSPRER